MHMASLAEKKDLEVFLDLSSNFVDGKNWRDM